jgi:hypothetical protein
MCSFINSLRPNGAEKPIENFISNQISYEKSMDLTNMKDDETLDQPFQKRDLCLQDLLHQLIIHLKEYLNDSNALNLIPIMENELEQAIQRLKVEEEKQSLSETLKICRNLFDNRKFKELLSKVEDISRNLMEINVPELRRLEKKTKEESISVENKNLILITG